MKVTQKIFSFLVLAAAVLTGCERDYDAPPLNEPVYEGPSANITIADLKENCKNATQETPVVVCLLARPGTVILVALPDDKIHRHPGLHHRLVGPVPLRRTLEIGSK